MTTPAPSTASYSLRYACVCDRGLRRSGNQDRAWADLDHRVFAVCDGVGGSQGGEIASQTAIETLQDAFYTPDNNPPLVRLQRAVHYANRDIYEMALRDVHLTGMATTIVALYLEGMTAYVGHAGDSRLYRFFKGALQQETQDHTDTQDAVRRGDLSIEEARQMGKKNVINRALGINPDVELETQSFPFEIGTRFLLCSDGITRHVPNTELADLMARHSDPQVLCEMLHERCYMRGAEDNLTALVVCVDGPDGPVETTNPPPEVQKVGIHGRFEIAETLDPNSGRLPQMNTSGEFRKSREQSIPPKSFPPERTNSKIHPLQEYLAKHRAATQRRIFIGSCIGMVLLGVAFWAGIQYEAAVKSLAEQSTSAVGTTSATQGQPQSPKNNLALAEEGRRDFEARNYKSASEKFLKLVDREPTRAEYRFWLGRSLLADRQSKDAVTQFEMTLTLDPNSHEAYVYLATARRLAGDAAGAEGTLKRYQEVLAKDAAAVNPR